MDHTLVWEEEKALEDPLYTASLFLPCILGQEKIKMIALIGNHKTAFVGDSKCISQEKALSVCKKICKILKDNNIGIKQE
jgi:hypothetical protein